VGNTRFYIKMHTAVPSLLDQGFYHKIQKQVYYLLAQSSPEFSEEMHENGRKYKNRTYKPFTYSHFLTKQIIPISQAQGWCLPACDFTWIVSTADAEFADHFQAGLSSFRGRTLEFGGAVNAQIKGIIVRDADISQFNTFRTMSPVCIKGKNDNGNSRYMMPSNKGYLDELKYNAMNKYASIHGKENEDVEFKLKNFKRGSHKTFAHKEASNDIVASYIDLEITGSPEMVNFIYYAGVGVRGSAGYGCMEVLP